MDPDARYLYEGEVYTYDELREVVRQDAIDIPPEDRPDLDRIVYDLLEWGRIEMLDDEDDAPAD